jgi:uncharacterized protein (TIGR03067 family)
LAAPISLDYREAPLDEVLKSLRNKTHLSIMVDESALKRLNMTEQRRISVKFSDITVKDALGLILQAADSRLTYRITDECVFITDGEKPAEDDPAQTEKPMSKADELKSVLRNVEKANERAQRELLRAQQQLRAEQDKSETDRQQEAKDLLPLRPKIADKEREVEEKHRLIDENRRALMDLQIRRQAELKKAAETDPRRQRQMQLRELEDAEAAKLEGTWKMVATHFDGRDIPNAKSSPKWVFQGHKIAVNVEKPGTDDDVILFETKDQWSTFFVNPTKTEKQLTIVGKNLLMQAIYRLDGDTLTVCSFGRSEVDRPTSFEPTKGDVQTHIVWTLRRIKPEAKQSF